MTAANPQTPEKPKGEKEAMTAAQAAKRVKRPVQVTEKGRDGEDKIVTKLVPVEASEVLAFKDYTTHVVVVTKDGQKFTDAEV